MAVRQDLLAIVDALARSPQSERLATTRRHEIDIGRTAEGKMKKMMMAAAAACVLVTPVPAADIMRNAPYAAAPANGFVWTGPYVGANLGYQWATATHTGADPNGFAGGIQGGYNLQIGQWVVGAETDLQLSGADDMFAGWKYSNPWFGTLRARGGYAMNNVLFYATLGMAYGRGEIELGGGLSETATHVGWTAGAGMEVGLTPHWSAKAEYLYVDLSDHRYVQFGTTGFESSLLRFGVNYRF
jgi:outer membrane immunogenic protein